MHLDAWSRCAVDVLQAQLLESLLVDGCAFVESEADVETPVVGDVVVVIDLDEGVSEIVEPRLCQSE